MPAIKTGSLAAHRDWRRNQLIQAAAEIALESGAHAVTVAAVATRAGLSRTSVYEYFASSADLAADLVIDELSHFASHLEEAQSGIADPIEGLEQWVRTSLIYIADGRHLLAKALNSTSLPQSRAAEIGAAHRALLAPLKSNLTSIGVSDLTQALHLIQAVTDTAAKRIEGECDAEAEITKTTAFCIAGIRALI